MEQRELKRLIEDCPISNFSESDESSTKHEIFDTYLDNFIKSYYLNEEELIEKFWIDCFGTSQILTLGTSKMIRHCVIFFDCAAAVYNFVSFKTDNKKMTELAKHISVQLQNDLKQFKSIITLALNECYNSVISEYRIMYESFVIGQYLILHPELIPIYNEHAQFLRYHLTRVVGKDCSEVNDIYNQYIEKYGKEFQENYGWTKTIIKEKKNRVLKTLFEECKLEKLFFRLYKFSSSYIHSSTFSVSTKSDLNYITVFLQVAMHFIESEITDYLRECKIPTKSSVVLRNFLLFLYNDFENEFCNKK